MKRLPNPLNLSLLSLLLALAARSGPVLCQDWTDRADWRASLYLHSEHLQEAGLRLPSYMPGIRDLFAYQGSLTTHQDFVVQWDSLPGRKEIMGYDKEEDIPLSGDFVLIERKQNVRGLVGDRYDKLNRSFVIVAVDGAGQVRGLQADFDPRIIVAEGAPRAVLIQPSVTLRFKMPDDPQIKSIIFFRAMPRPEGGGKLVRVGSIDLQAAGSAAPEK